jgi:hypothetical protein
MGIMSEKPQEPVGEFDFDVLRRKDGSHIWRRIDDLASVHHLSTPRNEPRGVSPTGSSGEGYPRSRVRKAIWHAIDAQKIIETIFYGEADMGCGQVPLALSGYVPQFKHYYKDPQRAKRARLGLAEPAPGLCAQALSYYTRFATVMNKRVQGYQPMGFRIVYLAGGSQCLPSGMPSDNQ